MLAVLHDAHLSTNTDSDFSYSRSACVCEATRVSSETIREIGNFLRREVVGVCVRVCVCVREATRLDAETIREIRIGVRREVAVMQEY